MIDTEPHAHYIEDNQLDRYESAVERSGVPTALGWRYVPRGELANQPKQIDRLLDAISTCLDRLNRQFGLSGKIRYVVGDFGTHACSTLVTYDLYVISVSYRYFNSLLDSLQSQFQKQSFSAALLNGGNPPAISPESDPKANNAFADRAWEICINIIIGHEYSHIKNGHLRFPGLRDLRKRTQSEDGDIDALLTIRALEFDADALSIAMIANDVDARNSVYCRDGSALLLPVAYRHGLFHFAVSSVFSYNYAHSVSSPNSRSATLWSGTHPPAWLRLELCLPTFLNCLNVPPTEHEHYYHELYLPSLNAFSALSGIALIDLIEPIGSMQKESNYYFSCIQSRWAKLRPTLDELKLAGPLSMASAEPR